ncbi:MAG: malonyl CoA-acyl carrier protein transacylase, partial [Actinomycetota bacterium]|nr:malonyl CoA-acyl carrier protein transacylase [Actinomycetota bacterium]
SPYMEPAAERLSAVLERTDFTTPAFPVYANSTGRPVEDPARQLSEQLVQPVQFAATLEQMAADGITTFIHVGPGDVTAGLVKRTLQDAVVHVVSDLGGIATVVSDPSVQ